MVQFYFGVDRMIKHSNSAILNVDVSEWDTKLGCIPETRA